MHAELKASDVSMVTELSVGSVRSKKKRSSCKYIDRQWKTLHVDIFVLCKFKIIFVYSYICNAEFPYNRYLHKMNIFVCF